MIHGQDEVIHRKLMLTNYVFDIHVCSRSLMSSKVIFKDVEGFRKQQSSYKRSSNGWLCTGEEIILVSLAMLGGTG